MTTRDLLRRLHSAQRLHAKPYSAREPGNLLVLGIGVWILVISLILGVTSAVAIHQARKELLAEADAIALALAQEITDTAYYSGAPTRYDAATITQAATRLAPAAPARLARTHIAGNAVVVTLEKPVGIPLVGEYFPSPQVTLRATAAAELVTLPG